MAVIEKISNITFRVSSLRNSTFFFENLLGLKKTAEWPYYVTFDVGGVLLGLEPGRKKGIKEGVTTVYLTVDDVDVEYERLRGKGIKFVTEPKNQSWGGRTAVFLDPDENTFILIGPVRKQD